MLPAYIAEVSPSQSMWTSQEPSASSRNISGSADRHIQTNAPPIIAPITKPLRGKRQAGISLRERETPNCFSAEVSNTTPAFAHATMNTAAFDATKAYCCLLYTSDAADE